MEKQCFVKGTEKESLEEVTTFVTGKQTGTWRQDNLWEEGCGSSYEMVMPSGKLGSDQKTAEHLKSQ